MSEWIIVPEGERDVSPGGWGAMLLDEVLFRGAQMVSELPGAPASGAITVEVPVTISVDIDPPAIVLRYTSTVDGTVVLRLSAPF